VKPRGPVVGALFILIGLAMIGVGAYLLLRTRDIVRTQDDTPRWTQTTAEIVSSGSHSQRNGRRSRSRVSHHIDLQYKYDAAGQSYAGTHWYWRDNKAAGRQHAEDAVKKFAPGTSVPAYYDPADPTRAVLVQGRSGRYHGNALTEHYIAAGAATCIGMLLAGVAARQWLRGRWA
jgi:hypothetical protein